MAELHPAVNVLLLSGLLIFWLTPISAWWMLARPIDMGSRLWFSGTAMYALVATLFAFGRSLPAVVNGPVVMALAMASVLCMAESIRREQSTRPAPLLRYGLGLGLHLAAMLVIYSQHLMLTLGLAVHLLLISGLEAWLAVQVNRLRRQSGSKALWLVMLVLLAFVAINLARVVEIMVTGRPSVLLDFSMLANISLVINYVSVVFYCYGYWGYALEKNRRAALLASEQAMVARHGELMALERERLATELLRQRTELMEQLSRVGKVAQSGALSATIAHEINQPLAAIQINTGEALRWSREFQVPEVLVRLLTRIEQDNQRAAQVVSRIRKIFASTRADYQLQSLDHTVQTVLGMLESRLKQADIQVTTLLAAPQPVPLSTGELQHTLINLLENAMDSLSLVPAAHRKLEVATWSDSKGLGMSVSDTGLGIAPPLRSGIFELLSTSKAEGLGIGLWLARFIVERHGGTLQLDESFHPGARFVVTLPNQDRVHRPDPSIEG